MENFNKSNIFLENEIRILTMIISTLKIETELNNQKLTLFPSLIRDNEDVYLIDCGYEETFEIFLNEMKKINIQPDYIKGIIISHDDIDHLGGLKKFKELNNSIKIYCGELEEMSISGKVKSERLIQAENSLASFSGDSKIWALNFISSLKNITRYKVDKTFADGEIFLDNIEIIHTPGHTRGHISLFIKSQKTLIANDALVLENSNFEIANPQFTLDIKNAVSSVEKIRYLKPDTIICYHGGIMKEDLDKKLADLISRFNN